MNEPLETIKYKNFNIEIHHDDMNESPREWDNLGTMVCWHSRYDLGDKHKYSDNESFWQELAMDLLDIEYEKIEEMELKHIQEKVLTKIIILPLFIYEHGGITMSTSNGSYPFNDRWDSGQVGWIYIEKKKCLDEWKKKKFTKQFKEKIINCLQGEVKIYDQYLIGDIYGYMAKDNEGEDIDSCWGFYGYDHKESGLLEQAENAIDCHIESTRKEHYKQLKIWIKNHVPFKNRSSCPVF